jgi:hypothetical protein
MFHPHEIQLLLDVWARKKCERPPEPTNLAEEIITTHYRSFVPRAPRMSAPPNSPVQCAVSATTRKSKIHEAKRNQALSFRNCFEDDSRAGPTCEKLRKEFEVEMDEGEGHASSRVSMMRGGDLMSMALPTPGEPIPAVLLDHGLSEGDMEQAIIACYRMLPFTLAPPTLGEPSRARRQEWGIRLSEDA